MLFATYPSLYQATVFLTGAASGIGEETLQVFAGHGGTTAELQREGRIQNPDLATQDTCHPVVISNPQTDRKTLYVNPGFTRHFDGWTEAESKPLLDFLYAHASRPEFTSCFSWRVGSMAVWDNRATWHFAMNDYTGQRRLMHRITLEGEPLH